MSFIFRYCNQSTIVDHIFPPACCGPNGHMNYSTFSYWRDPVPELIGTAEFYTIDETKKNDDKNSPAVAEGNTPAEPENPPTT